MFVEEELQVGEDQVMFRMGLTVRMPILKVEDIVLVVVTVILLQLNVKGNRIKTNFAVSESDAMYIISDRTLYHNPYFQVLFWKFGPRFRLRGSEN